MASHLRILPRLRQCASLPVRSLAVGVGVWRHGGFDRSWIHDRSLPPLLPPTASSLTASSPVAQHAHTRASTVPAAPQCPGHRLPAALKITAKAGPNHGKAFWSCAQADAAQRCRFFLWHTDWQTLERRFAHAAARPNPTPGEAAPVSGAIGGSDGRGSPHMVLSLQWWTPDRFVVSCNPFDRVALLPLFHAIPGSAAHADGTMPASAAHGGTGVSPGASAGHAPGQPPLHSHAPSSVSPTLWSFPWAAYGVFTDAVTTRVTAFRVTVVDVPRHLRPGTRPFPPPPSAAWPVWVFVLHASY